MGRARKKPEEQAEAAAAPEASEEVEAEAVTEDEPVAQDAAAEEPVAAEPAGAPAKPRKPSRTKEQREARAAAKKRTRARAKSSERKPIVREPKPERPRAKVKERRGVVVSNAMDKTIVVRVDSSRPHPAYKKVVRRSRKLHAHDAANQANVGDLVRIVETRPLSKTKCWRLVEIIEAAR